MEASEKPNNTFSETSRMEAFSDGVFAIAITLLILEIHVPDVVPGESLRHSLFEEWASFLAFLIGFFTILICWINHHYMFHLIQKCNSKLLLFNGFKLLIVTITPFATALLAKHIQTDWGVYAIRIYAFNFALMGLAMTCLWCYANHFGFAKASPQILKASTRFYIFATILSTMIWLVTYISIPASLALFVLMFLVFIFPEKMVAIIIRRSGRDTGMVES
jgi:uncharacterized membrane protein